LAISEIDRQLHLAIHNGRGGWFARVGSELDLDAPHFNYRRDLLGWRLALHFSWLKPADSET
jgi:hypothetical protein